MNGATTEFLYDGVNVIGEKTNTDVKTYVCGKEILLDSDGIFYHHDTHGSVSALVNAQNEVLAQNAYDAYGAGSVSPLSPFGYCGEYFDNETGFVYLRNRYYDTQTSRFLSEDTHWNPSNMIYGDDGNNSIPNINVIMQSSNRYIYCGNNPVNRYDPSGNNWITDRLSDAWKGTKWAFKTVGNYANEAQKAAQRTFWKTGSQLILRDHYGYETAAWLLEHSLQDNPGDV